MTHKEHNGWYNYETWLVNLWLDGAQDEYAQEAYDNAESSQYISRMEKATIDLADTIKSLVEDGNEIPESGLIADLVNAALSEVNWHEIAENWLSDVTQETGEVETVEA